MLEPLMTLVKNEALATIVEGLISDFSCIVKASLTEVEEC